MLLVFRAWLRLGSNVPSHWEFDRSDFVNVFSGTCIWARQLWSRGFMMPNCKDEERSCRAYMQWQVVWKEITALVGLATRIYGEDQVWRASRAGETCERDKGPHHHVTFSPSSSRESPA